LLDGEFVLLGEDGAPFLDFTKNKAYIVYGKFWVNNHAHILRIFGSNGSNKYLCHFLNQFSYKEYVTGTTRLKLNQSSMNNIPIKLAPLPEQYRIVSKIEELFSDLDNGIEQLKTAQQQLKIYRQAVLKWAFEGKLTEKWRKNYHVEPAEKLLEQIKEEREKQYQQSLKVWQKSLKEWESKGKEGKRPLKPRKPMDLPPLTETDQAELPKLPDGWHWLKLGNFTDIVGGVTKGRKLEGKKTITLPYLRVANVQDGFLDLSKIKYIDVLPDDLYRYKLDFGDILYTEGGDKDKLGRGTVWRNEIKACIHQNHIFRARPFQELTLPYFIAYFSQTKTAKNYFFKNAKQTVNLASINITVLSNLPVSICSYQEQHQIVQEIETRLSVCDNIEANIEESLQKAEALRQSILKKAFEGKLVPQDPNDEPANVLLVRIKAEKVNQDTEKKTNNRKKEKAL